MTCDSEAVLDAKKKRFTLNIDADTSVTVEPDDDVVGWAEAVTKALPVRYFGGEMSHWTKDSSEIPELVTLALDALQTHTQVEGLFRISGSKPEIDALRRLYDSGQRPTSLASYDVHTLTGALKLYLRLLPSPLVPFASYNAFLGLSNSPDIASAVTPLIQEFPLQNQLVLKAICQFVQKVSQHSSVNQMTCSNLAIVVAPNLMRPQVESMETATHSQHIIPVFAAIFEHADTIFSNVRSAASTPRSRPVSGIQLMLPPLPAPTSAGSLPSPGAPPPTLSLPPPPAATGSSEESANVGARRPVPMSGPPGPGPMKLPSIPTGGPKKGLRPTPPDGSVPPTQSPATGLPPPPASSGAGTNPLTTSSSGVPAGGPKKMAFLQQIQEKQKASSDAAASQPSSANDRMGAGMQQSPSADSISIHKSVSLSSLPKTPPGPFLKRPAPAVGGVPALGAGVSASAGAISNTGSTDMSLNEPSNSTNDLPKPIDSAPQLLTESAKKDKLEVGGSGLEEEPLSAEAAQWKTYTTDDGRKYFHNEVTNVTTWEKPECLKKRLKKHRKNLSSTSTTKDDTASGTPTKANLRRKVDRAQTTTTAPNINAVHALASSMSALPPQLPPPVSHLPPVIPASLPPPKAQSDSERIKTLEDKVATLERLVAEQAKAIEQLLSAQD